MRRLILLSVPISLSRHGQADSDVVRRAVRRDYLPVGASVEEVAVVDGRDGVEIDLRAHGTVDATGHMKGSHTGSISAVNEGGCVGIGQLDPRTFVRACRGVVGISQQHPDTDGLRHLVVMGAAGQQQWHQQDKDDGDYLCLHSC